MSLQLKRVALMFLTTGPLPHEQLWAEWLAQLEGALPLSALAAPGALCLRRCNQGAVLPGWAVRGGNARRSEPRS